MLYNINRVIDFISSRQNSNGSFATHERYPVVRPNEDWLVLPDSSPFITANILCSLLTVNDAALKPLLLKGCSSLQACMEHGAYWRFWPLIAKQHPIPLDMDDTSVASYVLRQMGLPVNNKNALAANCDSRGYFYTWLIPTGANIMNNPLQAFYFLRGCIHGLPTRLIKFYTYTDREPAVAANVLLYLGQNESTIKGINTLIADIKKGNFRLQFYHDEIMVYYHISRAYKAGVSMFVQLKDCIIERLNKRLANSNNMDELLLCMAAIVLLDFEVQTDIAQKLIAQVATGSMYPDKWKPLPYFSSENRNFLAGSPEFTAAIFVEAAHKLNQKLNQA